MKTSVRMFLSATTTLLVAVAANAQQTPAADLITRQEAVAAFQKVNTRLKENRARIEQVAVTADSALRLAQTRPAATAPSAPKSTGRRGYGSYTVERLGKTAAAWADSNGLGSASREEQATAFVNWLVYGRAPAPAAPDSTGKTTPPPAKPATTAPAPTAGTVNIDSLVTVAVASAVNGKLANLGSAVSTLNGQMTGVQAAQAVAWGEEPVTADMMAAVPENLQLGALATRKAASGNMKWAAEQINKLYGH